MEERKIGEIVNYTLTRKMYFTYRKTDMNIISNEIAFKILESLVKENHKSYNHRYNEKGIETPDAFYRTCKNYDLIELAKVSKLVDEYEYQTCEHPGFTTSLAKQFIIRVRTQLVRNMAEIIGERKDTPKTINTSVNKPESNRLSKEEYFQLRYWYAIDKEDYIKAGYYAKRLNKLGLDIRQLNRTSKPAEVESKLKELKRA